MQNSENKDVSKAEMLAQIIYEAVIRYTKARKALIGEKNTDLGLDISCDWRGNKTAKVDLLENDNDFKKHRF